MIYKYTKCESVIAKIMADANMSDKNLRITDIREWIFEAVEKIGAPMQYMEKESGTCGCPILEICDRQVPIPDDLESLVGVAYSTSPTGPWTPVRKNEQTFKQKQHKPHPVHNEMQIGPIYDHENFVIDEEASYMNVAEEAGDMYQHAPEQPMKYKQPVTKSQLYTEFNHSQKMHNIMNALVGGEPTYFVKPGWIVLNKPKGFVKLAYKSIATDERGYPLIPDLASYQEAIYWYVIMKLNFPKFLNGSLGGRAKYNFNTYAYLQQQWHHYRNQAYCEAMMPNEGEMMSIKNEWNKLLPDVNSDKNLFKSSGEEQTIYNDYYYGY